MVGDDVEISVVEVDGDAVRIGIKAPKDVSIYRREIYQAIQEENIRAARAAAEMAKKLGKVKPPSSGEKKAPDQKKKDDR